MSFDIVTIQAFIWKPQTRHLKPIWGLKQENVQSPTLDHTYCRYPIVAFKIKVMIKKWFPMAWKFLHCLALPQNSNIITYLSLNQQLNIAVIFMNEAAVTNTRPEHPYIHCLLSYQNIISAIIQTSLDINTR